ncbi:MAG: amidase [Rhodospirillales bacterium CG15_BIG_FIL_POST_REV_8_21_14_020_66_15]|nr:MAG: amidase [Rhodospirillales bacterium CG15_BIG_FIL_POST_REV_8_21_14_020_66_15]
MSLADLNATEAAAKIASGEITSVELISACLERIQEREPDVQAWAHLDPEYALEQARMRDAERASGRPVGPLHGVPAGVKDIFDTIAWPTENGTVLDAGRRPGQDSAAVQLLRHAGAVIMGKTVTTELAVYGPGKTRNPHNPAHTPGGSSSGSAAAVAAGMVPLAIGSQTNGSVIRPASFCGVYGFKPTFGRISRSGVLFLSQALDHVGVFARSIEDIALIGDALMRYDPLDPDMTPQGQAGLAETAASEPPLKPNLFFVKTAAWDLADADCKEAFAELADALGGRCQEQALPGPFDDAVKVQNTVMNVDLAGSLARYYELGADKLSPTLKGMIEQGRETRAVDYMGARAWKKIFNAALDEMFEECDAIITPATTGEAPQGLDTTGNPAFCSLWSFCGVPAITVPLLVGARGLPIGVQLIGPRNDDARLLRTARWLVETVAAMDG